MHAATVAFLRHLERERNASPNTIRAYGEDLRQFSAYLESALGREPRPEDADHVLIRGFLAELHRRGLKQGVLGPQARRAEDLLPLPVPGGPPGAQPRSGAALSAPGETDSRAPRGGPGRGAARRARRRRGVRPGPGDPGASLRHRDPLRRARGARRRRGRPRRPHGARPGQGPQGADRALRGPGPGGAAGLAGGARGAPAEVRRASSSTSGADASPTAACGPW